MDGRDKPGHDDGETVCMAGMSGDGMFEIR
jgi:hypothetical protein